jgi:rod shape-determining protein MreD
MTAQGTSTIIISFVISFILNAVPLPSFFLSVSIPWVAVVLAYWCIKSPQRISVISAWLIGILFDVLNGAVLGQHGLGFALIAYLTLSYQRQFVFAPPIQQTLFITLVILLYRGVTWQVYQSFGTVSYPFSYIWSAFLVPLVWVLVSVTFYDRSLNRRR